MAARWELGASCVPPNGQGPGRAPILLPLSRLPGVGVAGSPGITARTAREPSRLREGPAQEELDLAVQAAQLVRGPARQGRVEPRIEAQEERLPFGHRPRPIGRA